MYLVLYLQVCFVLVSSSPLYDFNCCANTYPKYGNDQPFVVQQSNYNPYALDALVHNRLNPITNSQSIQHQYPYLNTNNFVPNYQLYNQNGLDILLQNVPQTETEKVINNYILIPQEYFHNNDNENEKVKKTGAGISKNNKKNKTKRRRPHVHDKINKIDNADVSNQETKTNRPKSFREEAESVKSGRKKNKKKSNTNNSNQLATDVEETLPVKKVKNHEEAIIRNRNNNLISSCGINSIEKSKSASSKPHYQEPKTTKDSIKKEVVNDLIPDVNIKSKKDDNGFADVNVCFDINEDCTDLVCRHTRNKDINKKNKPQSLKPQPDVPNNLNNYMNSLTFNQQMNPNVFNPNVNFPFNFDYLSQMPQMSNGNPRESNNRRRNKKRKQPPSNRNTNLNKKNKNSITTIDRCDKVVELSPEISNVETTTLAPQITTKLQTTTLATQITTHTEEPEPESKHNVQVVIGLETVEDPNLDNPTSMYTETLLTEDLNNDEISHNNNVPFDNYNDVIDEYYPDFTLDNTYITNKEDYDFGNFHDRYYYTYEDKPELNRERRKYEHPNDNKLNDHSKIQMRNQNKNIRWEPSHIQEILCKTDAPTEKVNLATSSVLQFPGFKTEMIDKEKYFATEEYGSKNFDTNSISTNKMCPSLKHIEGKKNKNIGDVEMVFANSKVVRYGAPEKEEVIAKVPEPELKREFKNLISTDGKTTVVIAKSLGYS